MPSETHKERHYRLQAEHHAKQEGLKKAAAELAAKAETERQAELTKQAEKIRELEQKLEQLTAPKK